MCGLEYYSLDSPDFSCMISRMKYLILLLTPLLFACAVPQKETPFLCDGQIIYPNPNPVKNVQYYWKKGWLAGFEF